MKTAGTTAGTFIASVSVIPGQTGTSALSSCVPSAAQAAQGVNCVLGVLDDSGAGAGATADAPLFFSPPATLQTSDVYAGGTGTAAAYSVTLSSTGDFQPSGYPPNQSESGASIVAVANPQIPNNGGFATSGLVIQGTPTAPTTAPSGDAYVGGLLINLSTGTPASCQASSSPTATAWSGQQICSYGFAAGEPILLGVSGYTPIATAVPAGANPSTGVFNDEGNVPLSTGKVPGVSFFPIDTCTVNGTTCTTGVDISANADFYPSTTSNPGGFTATAAQVPYLGGVTAGRTTFAALGTSTFAESKGAVSLAYANFGPSAGS